MFILLFFPAFLFSHLYFIYSIFLFLTPLKTNDVVYSFRGLRGAHLMAQVWMAVTHVGVGVGQVTRHVEEGKHGPPPPRSPFSLWGFWKEERRTTWSSRLKAPFCHCVEAIRSACHSACAQSSSTQKHTGGWMQPDLFSTRRSVSLKCHCVTNNFSCHKHTKNIFKEQYFT